MILSKRLNSTFILSKLLIDNNITKIKKKDIVNDFINKIIPDPNSPPDVTFLDGYVGETGNKEMIRLYFCLSFDNYADIPIDKIIHYEHVDNVKYPLGVTYIWLHKDTEITVKHVQGKRKFEESITVGRLRRQRISENIKGIVEGGGITSFTEVDPSSEKGGRGGSGDEPISEPGNIAGPSDM